MILNHALDLEYIYNKHGIKLASLILELKCISSSAGDYERRELVLIVKPVNEYAPEFVQSLLEIHLAESIKVGTKVFMLRLKAIDRDVNPYTSELYLFDIWTYLPDPNVDGWKHFALNDSYYGSVVLAKALDYESLNASGATTLFLNVSASDVHGLTTFATLTVHVDDVDDLPPEFYHPGCPRSVVRSKPCVVSYEARVPVQFKGPLTNLSPGRVSAKDMDSLDAKIIYSLETAPDEKPDVLLKFVINMTTGSINLASPIMQPQVVHLVIVAQEVSDLSRSTQAIFTVTVFQETDKLDVGMLKPESPTKSENEDAGKDPPLYLILTLAVGFLMLLIHFIICMVYVKHKSGQRPRVSPLPPGAEDSCTNLRYNHHGSIISLSTKPQQAAPLQTRSYLQASEYCVNKDGTVSQAKMTLKYASKSISEAGYNSPDLLSHSVKQKSARSVAGKNPDDKSLASIVVSEKDTSSNNKVRLMLEKGPNGQNEDTGSFNLLQEDSKEENQESSIRSSPMSVSTELSSATAGTHILTPDLSGKDNSSTKYHSPVENPERHLEQPNTDWNNHQLDLQNDTQKFCQSPPLPHEWNNNMCVGDEKFQSSSQKALGMYPFTQPLPIECKNTTIILSGRRSSSSTSTSNVSHTTESTKGENSFPNELQKTQILYGYDTRSVCESERCTEGRALIFAKERKNIGHNALSLLTMDKVSTETDADIFEAGDPSIAFQKEIKQPSQEINSNTESYNKTTAVQMPEKVKQTAHSMDQQPDFSMFRPHTGPGHHSRPHTMPSAFIEDSSVAKLEESEEQRPVTRLTLERKRRKKKSKKERREVGSKQLDKFEYLGRGRLGFDNIPNHQCFTQQNTAKPHHNIAREENYTFHNSTEPGQRLRYVVMDSQRLSTSPAVEVSSSLQESIENGFVNSMSDQEEQKSPHTTKRSVSGKRKSVRLDKSRLQPYMLLQHDKQMQEQGKQLQIHTKSENQQIRKSCQSPFHKHHMRQQNYEYKYQQEHKHHMRQQSHEQSEQEQQQLPEAFPLCHKRNYFLAQQENTHEQQEHQLQNHKSKRAMSEQCTMLKGRESRKQLPATAPALLNTENDDIESRDQHDEGERKQHVQNWVNSTH